MAQPTDNSSTLMLSPQRNVTFAVNYEASTVDRFWQKSGPARLGKQQNKLESSAVAPVLNSTDVNPIEGNNGATQSTTLSSNDVVNNTENAPKNLPFDSTSLQSPETTKPTLSSLSSDEDSSGSCKENKKKLVTIKSPTQRRSSREMKKRQVPIERSRVRYDMELVPAVKRNRAFLDKFPLWSTPSRTREDKIKALLFQQQKVIRQQQEQLQAARKQAAQKLQEQTAQKQPQPMEQKKQQPVLVDQKQHEKVLKVNEQQQNVLPLSNLQQDQNQDSLPALTDTSSDTENLAMEIQDLQDVDDMSPELVADEEEISPFAEDTSVVWVPKKRSEWEDSVLEMTAVCTSASMRRHMATRGRSSSTKPFHAPLSKEYIKDRVDIDDPLNGYQIRHKTGGWLQGFILWTNFTTWTHYFKWDSSHAMSGIPTMSNGINKAVVDSDGSLAAELESQPRSGNPFEGGVVFEAVAEISLVGGLGCGEYLLRMALESILATRKYKFVVLQATDSSKTFYERFGFVRVGAICRYERKKDKDAGKPSTRPGTPIMGYRHWTHPNESDTSLQKHGGPSYMMCLKLPEIDDDVPIETPFLDAMLKLEVEYKPTIEQLGGSSTPHPTKSRRASLEGATSDTRKFGRGRRGSNGSPETISAPSLSQSFSSSVHSPPVLPILRGSNAANNPSRNIVCSPGPVQEKIAPRRSSGVKRTGDAGDDSNPSTKKRRLVESGITEKQGVVATPKNGSKGAPRRTPRTLSNQPAIPTTVAAEPRTGKKSSVLPANNPPQSIEPLSSKKKNKRSTPRRSPAPDPTPTSATSSTQTPVSERTSDAHRSAGPLKQKVKSYPRDRVHYYNKVVRPKKGKKTENYFVLHYDEGKGTIRIIPMEPRGVLSGKRAGRPRFQAVMDNFDRDAKTVRCADYDIVKAFMVMKTPVVASEAWDVLDA